MKLLCSFFTNFPRVSSIVAVFCLLCFFPAGTDAQALKGPESLESSTAWLDAPVARQVLIDQVLTLEPELAQAVSGSPEYYDLQRRILYYKAIALAIQKGENVSSALQSSLNYAASMGGRQEVSFTPGPVLRALFDQTRNLLSN